MGRFLGINCATTYFFSPELGKMLGISEAEPDLVHSALIRRTKEAYTLMQEDGYV
jgi:hypothetical protein